MKPKDATIFLEAEKADGKSFAENEDFDSAAQFQNKSFANKQIGNYRILCEIGRGGMGAVFLAVRADNQFEQQVAVKIIGQTFADRQTERHFRRERQILASLNHPNIARFLDGGLSADGLPFFVMERIEGEPLLEFAESHRLDRKARLELFLKICAAVSFAHRNLVVHRDIKPSNVLVTNDGEPKLLDFGLAKTLDAATDADRTDTVFRAASPAYAAPEQLRGQAVTTAADVYSLGVVLTELLTGHLPSSVINPNSTENSANQKSEIRNQKSLSGDLKNIAAMAVREEPERRYATVEQFAADIERHLKGLPIAARPATFFYRARKFVERNKYAATAFALILLTLIASSLISLWQANEARAARDRATRRFEDVRRLSNSLLFELSPQIERIPGATEARRLLAGRALEYLDSLAGEAGGDDAGLQSELASAYEKVGDIQGNPTNPNTGDLRSAIASYEKAQNIRRELLEKSPDNVEQRASLAANHRALGDLRWQSGELEESVRQTETALDLYEKLTAENPDRIELRLALAQTIYDAGQARSVGQKYAESLTYFQKALALLENLRQNNPDNNQILKLVGNCHQQLGNALSWNAQQKEGEAEMAKAIEIYESLVRRNPHDVGFLNGLWQTYWLTASVYEEQNDGLSHEFALKALKTIQSVVDRDSADVQARKRLARSFSQLGQTSTNTGKPTEAVIYLEKSVAELQRLLDSDPASGTTKNNLGVALIRLGEAKAEQKDFAAAFANLEKADRFYAELLRTDPNETGALRKQALIAQSIGEIYEKMTENAAAVQARANYRQTARASYQKAFDLLTILDAKKSLSEYDRKLLEKMRVAAAVK